MTKVSGVQRLPGDIQLLKAAVSTSSVKADDVYMKAGSLTTFTFGSLMALSCAAVASIPALYTLQANSFFF